MVFVLSTCRPSVGFAGRYARADQTREGLDQGRPTCYGRVRAVGSAAASALRRGAASTRLPRASPECEVWISGGALLTVDGVLGDTAVAEFREERYVVQDS